MLRKILEIARTRLYIAYSDRGALMLMFLAPMAVSLITALAFGNIDEDITIETSQLVVVNQDEGTTGPQGEINSGQTYVEVLVENTPEELQDLVEGEIGTDPDAAREAVQDGELVAAIIIPAGFSANVQNGQGEVELYHNAGDQIQSAIVTAIVQQITATLNTGRIAENIFLGTESGYLLEKGEGNAEQIGAAAEDALTQLYSGQIEQPVTLTTVNVEGEEQNFNALQYFAPSMAILFMTFTMAAGAKSVLEDQENWTLQRIITTPTPRWVYLMGKMLGTFVSGVLQMTILLVVTSIVAVLLGQEADIWGTNYIGLALITLGVVAAATGLGMLISAISKTSRQADSIASAVLVVTAMLSGAFVSVENIAVLATIRQATLNFWGLDGYTDLAANNASIGEISDNILALVLMAGVFFGLALWRFNKRLDV
jgi:ABC-2 type transport system permease protein